MRRALLLVWFALLTANLPFAALSPKVWLLLAMYLVLGFAQGRSVQPKWMIATLALTGGTCNNWAPAWELNSRSLIFASDCDRGLGMPALYRADIPAR